MVRGTAIRCVSRYSESRMMRSEGTMFVRDLVVRLPLFVKVGLAKNENPEE